MRGVRSCGDTSTALQGRAAVQRRGHDGVAGEPDGAGLHSRGLRVRGVLRAGWQQGRLAGPGAHARLGLHHVRRDFQGRLGAGPRSLRQGKPPKVQTPLPWGPQPHDSADIQVSNALTDAAHWPLPAVADVQAD